MKLVCQLRVKNEEKNIRRCLDNLLFVNHFCIVDNGSTDKTLEILKEYKNVTIEKTEGLHDGKDKKLALEMVKKLNPEWILWMDADEVFEEKAKTELIKLLNNKVSGFCFRIFPFVNSKKYYRIDRNWKQFSENGQVRLFRNQSKIYWDDSIQYSGHSGMIKGLTGQVIKSDLRIKHYTIQSLKEAIEKYNLYSLNSKKTLDRRTYEHLIDDVDAVYKKWIE